MVAPLRRLGSESARVSSAPQLRIVKGSGAYAPVRVDPEPEETGLGGAGSASGRLVSGDEITFDRIYADWFQHVVRWTRALGGPNVDTEDLAQEIFMVVRRKLSTFLGGNLAGWLYRITQLTVRDQRRRAWFRNLVLRRSDVDMDRMLSSRETPAGSLERQEQRKLLDHILGKMSEKRRTTFVLFEIEGYKGEEIAAIQDIPLSTVWTRLHHARKDFWRLVGDLREIGEA